jgi:hypothetical protein
MNDESASLRRVAKYVFPVVFFSILFNVPKFFEAEIAWHSHEERDEATGTTTNVSWPVLDVSDLRMNPDYATYYNNWARLAVLGIIPVAMLIFFNTKIYQDIQVGLTNE